MGVQARDKTVQLGCDALGRPCACAIPAEQDRSKVALADLDTMLEDAELRDVKQAFWKRCRMRFPAEVRTSCYPAFLESFSGRILYVHQHRLLGLGGLPADICVWIRVCQTT